jgi:hypothetical protein
VTAEQFIANSTRETFSSTSPQMSSQLSPLLSTPIFPEEKRLLSLYAVDAPAMEEIYNV